MSLAPQLPVWDSHVVTAGLNHYPQQLLTLDIHFNTESTTFMSLPGLFLAFSIFYPHIMHHQLLSPLPSSLLGFLYGRSQRKKIFLYISSSLEPFRLSRLQSVHNLPTPYPLCFTLQYLPQRA